MHLDQPLGQSGVLLKRADHVVQEAADGVFGDLAAEVPDPGAQLALAVRGVAVHLAHLLADLPRRFIQGVALVLRDGLHLERLTLGADGDHGDALGRLRQVEVLLLRLGADRLDVLGDLLLDLVAGLAQLGFVGLAGEGLGQRLTQLRRPAAGHRAGAGAARGSCSDRPSPPVPGVRPRRPAGTPGWRSCARCAPRR